METRKYHTTTEKNLQEKSLIEQISTLNEHLAAELEKVISKMKESISLVQNVADSSWGESKMKLDKAIKIYNSAIEIISSKNNSHSVGIEKITSPSALQTSEFLKEYSEAQLGVVLRKIGKNWNFDAFFLKSCTNDKSISIPGCYCLKKYGLGEIFSIPKSVYRSFFEALEKRYNNNPFHNAVHALDMLNSSIYFIFNSKLDDYMPSCLWLAIIIACLGHDVGHPGFSNRFLVTNKNELAILYNDFSVLEMMHCSTIFQLMSQSSTNILGTLSSDFYIQTRKNIIEMILATDMSKHFEILGQFRAKMINSPLDYGILYFENKVNIMKIMIKCADIGYTAKQKEINEKWSLLLTEEHFNQGDMQKLKGQPVSMYCDRENADIVKSQVGILKNIALPLFEGFNQFLQSADISSNCVDQLKINIKSWENMSRRRNKSQIVNKKEYNFEYDKLLKKWLQRKKSSTFPNIKEIE